MAGRIKYAFALAAAFALAVAFCPDSAAFSWPWSKKKAATEAEAPAPAKKKTPYQKFTRKKGLVKCEGFVNIYKDGTDIWLEIPDSLDGCRILTNAVVKSSSDPRIGRYASVATNNVLTVGIQDSIVVLSTPCTNIIVSDSDEGISDALALSKTGATKMVFPIKYRNSDSTAVVVKATKLFAINNKDVVKWKGLSYDGNKVSSSKMKDGSNRIVGIDAFATTVGVSNEGAFEFGLGGPMGGELVYRPQIVAEVFSSISLVPENDAPRKVADSRIGTRNVSFTSFSSTAGTHKDKWAVRWDLRDGKTIRIQMDTLLPESYRAAISAALKEWDGAFEAAGLGSRIEIVDFTPETNLADPFVSAVYFSSSSNEDLSASILNVGPEILSYKIEVPGNFINGVRKMAIPVISDVDTRFARYDLPDDAVCDVMKAEVLRLFGYGLGMGINAAGSYAFTPDQLRDPAFTQEHGLLNSVMDDNMFNVLAMPGDRERGVVTVVDRIGEYDKYAVSWIYGDDENFQFRDDMLYIPSQSPIIDPRGLLGDLGTDKFAELEAVKQHSLNIAESCISWIGGDNVKQSYSELFLDWIWLQIFYAQYRLSSLLGGMYISDCREGSTAPRYVAVDPVLQKKAFAAMNEAQVASDKLGENKYLMHVAGANKNTVAFNNTNKFSNLNVKLRLNAIELCAETTGCTYDAAAFLGDVQKEMLKNVRLGKIDEGENLSLQQYISFLISYNPVYKQNFKDVLSPTGATGDYRTVIDGYPVAIFENLDAVCTKSLLDAQKIILAGKSRAKDDYTRREIDFLLKMIEAATEGRK